MIRVYASCILSGDTFSPRLAEQITGLRFSAKNEPGEIGTRGRYKGQPRPYGAAVLEAPFDSVTKPESVMPEEWVADALGLHIETFRSCGAMWIELDLNITWQDQCNLAFDAAFLQKLGKLNIDLSISCYEGPIDGQEEAE